MKIRFLTVLLLLAAIVIGVAYYHRQNAANAAEPTKKPLTMTFTDINGKKIKMADYRGKVVVIDVWATWCGYCVAEIPDLIKYQQEQIDKKTNVQLIGLSIDRSKKDVQAFVKENKLNYPIIVADRAALKPFGSIPGVPMKFIVNKKGVIVDTRVGAGDIKELEEAVAKYLKE